ncbi:diaminopimelate epimerase, partial [Georgenia sp. 10Sc9-8]|nr:diaminopimelate epimerase [Georgenia halotolerans]
MTPPALADVTLTKGHGTENDFVLVPDPDGALDLDAATVAHLCDRRAGIGADGLIRVVRSAALAEGKAALREGAEWFMDYRNADGSAAEMCGNGIRVFVDYLRRRGLVDLDEGATVPVGTRGGVRPVTFAGGLYTVDMGRWSFPGGQQALDQGYDVAVQVAGLEEQRAGLRVAMPNPHTVVALPDVAELAAADLTREARYDP